MVKNQYVIFKNLLHSLRKTDSIYRLDRFFNIDWQSNSKNYNELHYFRTKLL